MRHARFVDREGRPLHAPGERVSAETLTRLEQPEPPRQPDLPRPPEPRVTLASLPAVVDGAWWRRHADLIDGKKGKGFEFRAGVPQPASDDAEEGDAVADTRPGEPLDPGAVLDGLVGQEMRVERFRTMAAGSRELGEPFPHTLFLGPPGTGKTTLARGVAALLGTRLHTTAGPLLGDASALVGILAGLGEGDVLFLDEVHAVPPSVLEVLYEALDEQRLSLTLRAGGRARTIRLELPTFTLLAATTEGALVPDALKSRFLLREWLGLYAEGDLEALVTATARARGYDLPPTAAATLAWHARGTPREALRLLACVLLNVAGWGEPRIHETAADETLGSLGYDADGLRPEEHRYLDVLRAHGGPVPLWLVARELRTSCAEVKRDLEPYLFEQGWIQMTSQGRMAVEIPRLRIACGD